MQLNHVFNYWCHLEELKNGFTHGPNPESRHWPIVLFFAIVLGTPWIMRKLLQLANIDRKSYKNWQKGTTFCFLSVWLVIAVLKLIDTFQVADLFLYPLKTSENWRFPDIPAGIEREQWHEMG